MFHACNSNDFVLSFSWLLITYLIKNENIFLPKKKQSKSIEELLKNGNSLDELRDIWFYNKTNEFIQAIIDHRKYLFPFYDDYESRYNGNNIDDIDDLSMTEKTVLCALILEDTKYEFAMFVVL